MTLTNNFSNNWALKSEIWTDVLVILRVVEADNYCSYLVSQVVVEAKILPDVNLKLNDL